MESKARRFRSDTDAGVGKKWSRRNRSDTDSGVGNMSHAEPAPLSDLKLEIYGMPNPFPLPILELQNKITLTRFCFATNPGVGRVTHADSAPESILELEEQVTPRRLRYRSWNWETSSSKFRSATDAGVEMKNHADSDSAG